MWFAREGNRWVGGGDGPVDVILSNDMLSVSDLRALLPSGQRDVPIACYFHENQLTYPIPDEQARDYQYGMTNIASCLAADAVWFNSRFHLEDFLSAAARLLAKMPDFVPEGIPEAIRCKSAVLAPPVDIQQADRSKRSLKDVLTFLWCHRWEYDKNPEPFFDALMRLDEEGLDFRVVLLGEQFRSAPQVFSDVWHRLKPHVLHAGFLLDRREYLSMLGQCDIVVSTAIQENFGIAVVEAILAGCQPLLPNRLVYPELIPSRWHDICLYPADQDLFEWLRDLIRGDGIMGAEERQELQETVQARFGVANAVGRLDDALSDLAANRTGKGPKSGLGAADGRVESQY